MYYFTSGDMKEISGLEIEYLINYNKIPHIFRNAKIEP